ncbi:PPC domain-containing DNA-binding protein [Streptococcus castoreus]|uniref:PPC domain-containing DNA-binding protein n=1 Tax=Streptococcus castoreus TaxID=254786 RepID=UPI0003F8CE3D|nr:DUF296 domain-containing protein [Streptococcus castoreus]
MEFQKIGTDYFIRVDKGDEILSSIIEVCRFARITSAIFQGIGACDQVVVSTYLPETESFLDHKKQGMLEMISLNGNVVQGKNNFSQHAHALFSYLNDQQEMAFLGGHLTSARVRYTAEIKLSPVEGTIHQCFDPNIGIDVWDLKQT